MMSGKNTSYITDIKSPFERYIHLLPGAQFDLHHNTSITFKPASIGNASQDVELRVEDLAVKETTFFLEWVPMTYSSDLVEKLLSSIGLQPTSLRRDAHSADKWAVTVGVDQSEVPHYIYAPRFSLSGQEKGHSKVLVTVPKRWTECEHCRSVNHRSHKCANKRRRKNEQYVPRHQIQNVTENRWTKPNQTTKTKTTNNTQVGREPLSTYNRFNFSHLYDPETESEAAGDDDDFLSVASTPNADSQASLFSQPPPGTFDFKAGKVNPRKATLRQKTSKKEASKAKLATPSGKGSKKGVTNWFDPTPTRRGRPRTPRSEPPAKSSNDGNQSGKKRQLLSRNDNTKRTRIDSPTTHTQNESIKSVSETISGDPLTDQLTGPSNKVSEVLDVVPSSLPVADALLAGGGPPPPPRPVDTLGVGAVTGQSSQGLSLDDSQYESQSNKICNEKTDIRL